MKKIGLVIVSFLAANPLFAQTSPLSYDYVEANLGTGDFFDEDFSFYGVGGSYSINENIFLLGSYYDGATDDDISFNPSVSGKLEISSYEIGAGFHTPLSQTLDLVFSGSYVDTELEAFGISEHGDGYSVDAGLRFKPAARLELNAFVDYSDVESDGETGYSASAYFFLTETFSAGLIYEGADDVDTLAASVRLHF